LRGGKKLKKEEKKPEKRAMGTGLSIRAASADVSA